jgi:ankyrin repeat protein
MPRPHPAPTRSLPVKPSLVQLRKQAKDLLKSYVAGQHAAVTEVNRFEQNPDPARFALADAQRVLARAYGFSSWAKLKQHVDGLNVEAFGAAVEAGDVATVRKLAKARPELVSIERGGEFGEMIALHFAVLHRDAEMTRALMELGSDARKGVWPHRDATAAYTIAREREYDEIVAIIQEGEERRRKALGSPGATISSKTDEIHKAMLNDRCDEAIRLLESDLSLIGACNVERGLNDVDGRRLAQGATPLHVAAWKHNSEMVAWLLDRQASADVRDVEGKTPLDYAAIVAGWSANDRFFPFLENVRIEPAHFHETVRWLRAKGAELTPRAAVAIGDQQAVLQMHREGRLINEIHFYRGGLLAIAVRVHRSAMVSLLLDLGFDPNEPAASTEDGRESWGMPLWFAAVCGRHEIAQRLLARGADVNAIVHACGDALSIAHATGDERMKSLLLEHGARTTVEHVAASRDRETAKAILDGTLAAHSLNVEEPSPTDLAEQMLWAAGGSDPEIVRMCLPHMKRKRDDPWWNYVLMHAALPDSFKLILEHGVDPDVATGGGYTTLHHLATAHVNEEGRLARATMLLDAGASLSQRESLLKSTPLGWACRWGRLDLVELYLARGADAVESAAEPWATPLAWAMKCGHQDIAELIRSHGAR